jgi:uncharacterized membrane protein
MEDDRGQPAQVEPGERKFLEASAGLPKPRTIGFDAPWRWLGKGWQDLRAAPAASLFYGAILTVMGVVLTQFAGSGALALAFLSGFLLVGPFVLMGLYDISRRRERGEPVVLAHTMSAWQDNAPAIGFCALILMLLLAVWLRISSVVVALFFPDGMPSGSALVAQLMENPDSLGFVAAYVAAGFGFALFVFATSVVSLPMLLDRKSMDTLSAMITSFNALRANFWPMVLWGVVIVTLVGAGFATFYLGLLAVLPLIGHATWHAYREVVE